jgi:hypothetical protein
MIFHARLLKSFPAAFVLLAASFATGCVDGGGGPTPDPICDSAAQSFVNQTGESLVVTLTGPDTHTVYLPAFSSTVDGFYAGTYTLEVTPETGPFAGIVIADATFTASCGQTLPIYTVINNMAIYEMSNSTGADLWITIDGEVQNILLNGETAQYILDASIAHHITIEDDYTGSLVWDYDQTLEGNTLTPIALDPFDPIIELHNDWPTGSPCIYTKVYAPDTSSIDADWIVFQNSIGSDTYEVCPGEIGYFAWFAGNWTIEFFDGSTEVPESMYSETLDLYNHDTIPYFYE